MPSFSASVANYQQKSKGCAPWVDNLDAFFSKFAPGAQYATPLCSDAA